MGELIVCQSLRRPSVVRPSVHPSTVSNIFSSETTGRIERGWTGGYPIPSSLPLSSQFPPPSPPLPSPFSPTSIPLSDFSLPLIRFCSYPRTKAYIYVSEELRIVHDRLSCRIFMPCRQRTRLSPDLSMSFLEPAKETLFVLGKTKKLLFMVNFGAYSILSLFVILKGLFSRLFKGFLFNFSYKKFVKKSLQNYRPLNILKILKR